MNEFLSNTVVRVAIVTVGTVAVSAGSYLIGKQHGFAEAVDQIPELVQRMIEEAKNVITDEEQN